MYNLMIVEAPPKAKKIESILKECGLNFRVMATSGYLVDLPKEEYALKFNEKGVDIKWVFGEGKKQLIEEIKKVALNANKIYIATDDDREGEKIAKDIIEKLNLKDYERVVFSAIIKNRILEAIESPRNLNDNEIKSAVARRVIDRDIGYPVSEILRWDLRRKGIVIPHNLGCGRTISPTLHILNENQKAIDSFEKEEYKRIKVWYQKDGVNFHGLYDVRFMIHSNANMLQMELVVEQMRKNPHTIVRYSPKNREEAPPEPLTTVLIQQSASNIYGFKGKYTMELAQLLYYLGFITYHRTDSNIQSEETYLELIDYLYEKFDEDDVLPTKRKIKQRSLNVQKGHESIRPVVITDEFHPDNIIDYWKRNGLFKTDSKNNKYKFTEDHAKVYEIIWYRTLAVQMRDAVYDASEAVIDIAGNKINLRANKLKTIQLYEGGEKTLSGWLGLKSLLLRKSTVISEDEYVHDEVSIPEFIEGSELSVVDITYIEDVTRPPYLYGEGRLIRKIDAAGIVRPSTLASVLPSLESKKCIVYVGKTVQITRLGQVVDDWISEHAFWLNDLEMAQKFEETLDKIANKEDGINETDFIMDYHERINALKEKLDYKDDESKEPYDWQIKKALEIAKINGVEIGEEIFKSREKIEIFLTNNLPKKEYSTLGKCPSCKKGKISENSSAFGCSGYKEGCKFVLWKKNINTFFEKFGAQVTDSYIINVIIAALKKEPLLYVGLISAKGDKFDAFIDIKKNKEFSNWSLSLKFDNERKDKIKQEESAGNKTILIEKKYKNFRTQDEFKNKFNVLFVQEGNASLCYSKLFIPSFSKISDSYIDYIGEEVSEYLASKNAMLFIDNQDKRLLMILSNQPNSEKFKNIIEDVCRIINSLEKTSSPKTIAGITYRRFNNNIEEMENKMNILLKEAYVSIKEEAFKISESGGF